MVLSAGKWDHSEVQRAQESCGAQRGGAGGGLPCSGRAPRSVGKQEAAREASEGSMGPALDSSLGLLSSRGSRLMALPL